MVRVLTIMRCNIYSIHVYAKTFANRYRPLDICTRLVLDIVLMVDLWFRRKHDLHLVRNDSEVENHKFCSRDKYLVRMLPFDVHRPFDSSDTEKCLHNRCINTFLVKFSSAKPITLLYLLKVFT